MLCNNHKIEAVRYSDWTYDIEGRSAGGEIAHCAIDAAAAELDGSGLKDAVTWGDAVLVHGASKVAQKSCQTDN